LAQRASSSSRRASLLLASCSGSLAGELVAASDSRAFTAPLSGAMTVPASGLGRIVLIQALGDLDKQAGEKIAVGLDVAELGEHPVDGCPGVFLAPPHLLAQSLHLVGDAIGEFGALARELVGDLGEALLQGLGVLPQAAFQVLLGIGTQALFFAELGGDRFELLLDRRFETAHAARCLRFQIAQLLL